MAARDRGTSVLLTHLTRLLRLQSEEALAPLGLRPRHVVALTVLRDHSGGTQQDLAALLSVDRTNLVGLLNELEAPGLIARRRDEADRRRHLVELTGAGAARLAEAQAALEATEDHVLGALGPDERRELHALLARASAGAAAQCTGAEAGAGEACRAAAEEAELTRACLAADEPGAC